MPIFNDVTMPCRDIPTPPATSGDEAFPFSD